MFKKEHKQTFFIFFDLLKTSTYGKLLLNFTLELPNILSVNFKNPDCKLKLLNFSNNMHSNKLNIMTDNISSLQLLIWYSVCRQQNVTPHSNFSEILTSFFVLVKLIMINAFLFLINHSSYASFATF